MSTPELQWFKSSYSSSNEPGDCVEVATTPTAVHIRDSKTPRTAQLKITPSAWARFLTTLPT
ncbi:DUF397 domain-containing protein [Streptomyces dangxiongensis]|uniref:DUF397 domain-containing protein n=1 Tax=Streptomyces dangxiongensis TaxID=1442032 RepID=A0A3G2JKP9_9ACTN|nr:DUF397 domain-containing protein [Streptomyces dangxiongensis]AYN40892.1 DUF397 domain-containing protein [Streptomyces dangxiongensis]